MSKSQISPCSPVPLRIHGRVCDESEDAQVVPTWIGADVVGWGRGPQVVLLGAGGTIGDWEGGEDFGPGRVLAAASRELYDQAIGLLTMQG